MLVTDLVLMSPKAVLLSLRFKNTYSTEGTSLWKTYALKTILAQIEEKRAVTFINAKGAVQFILITKMHLRPYSGSPFS